MVIVLESGFLCARGRVENVILKRPIRNPKRANLAPKYCPGNQKWVNLRPLNYCARGWVDMQSYKINLKVKTFAVVFLSKNPRSILGRYGHA